jgi:hypothetical protein
MVVNDAIVRGCEAVPKWPKAASRVGKRNVVGMLTEEMAIVYAGSGMANSAGVQKGAI